MRLEGVTKALVNALFKYGFPIPIKDLEDYCSELATWIEAFIQKPYES
jgi:hypothetical protein